MLDLLKKIRDFLDMLKNAVDSFVSMAEGIIDHFLPPGAIGRVGAFDFSGILNSLKQAAMAWILSNLPKFFSASAELA